MRYTVSTTINALDQKNADEFVAMLNIPGFTAHPVESRSELVRVKHLPADDAGHPHRIRVMWQGRQHTEQFDHAARDAAEHAVTAALGCTRAEYVKITRGSATYKAIWE